MIHPTAIIHRSARVSPDAEIGPYAIIGENTVIGPRVRIGPHAVVEFAEVGEGCSIFGHASVGTAPQDLKYKNEETKLILGPGCTVREFTTLNRGTTATGKTVIGANCLFMAYAHVGHDSIIGNGVIMANAATLGGHVEVGDFAFLGGLVAVHQFVRIGTLAMLGGGSMVSLDIMPYAQAQGDRAKLVGLNLVGMKRRSVARESMDEIKQAYRTLFLSGLPLDEALDQLEAEDPCREVGEITAFIRASKRGITRPRKKAVAEE